MRWLVALVVVVACAKPNEVRFTATYDRDFLAIDPHVVEAIKDAGYAIEQDEETEIADRIVTRAIHLYPTDPVAVAFVVVVESGGVTNAPGMAGKIQYAVTIVPHAYNADGHEVAENRLPASATTKARVLSEHIRQHLRRYEMP